MRNSIGREIPEQFLRGGREVYQGPFYREGYIYQKAAPSVRASVSPRASKVVSSLTEVIIKCGLRDGMCVSFHHHFRDGDYVLCMVMDAIAALGIKDITICASSLGDAHTSIVKYMEDGTITGISSSGVRGAIGEAISLGKLKTPAMIRSHGGRVRAIECGDIHIDMAFIGAPTSDCTGNARGKGGKSDCGVLSYSAVDARYADHVVVVTDCLVEFPNLPASIQGIDVDYIVVVDEVGDPTKIANATLRYTTDPRELMIADYAARIMRHTPYFRDGFSFQTGGGGPSLAVTRFLRPYMEELGIKMGFAMGGITRPIVELLEAGFIRMVVDAQDFDLASVKSVNSCPNHVEITTAQYANPLNKGAFVNRLDYVILGALEVDLDFHVNVVTGSDGIIRGAPGGHVDTSAGSRCSIIVTPLCRSRIPTIRDRVLTVTTPGETVDIVVTEVGAAVNPRRPDLLEALRDAPVPILTIEELKERAYALVGIPDPIRFTERVVALIEYRDGTIIDVVYQIAE